MEDFKDPFDLTLGDERHAAIGYETFPGDERRPDKIVLLLFQPRSLHTPPFEGDASGIPLPQAHAGSLDGPAPKPAPRRIFERLSVRVQEEDAGGIDVQLARHLGEDDAQGETLVETRCDRLVNRVLRVQAL